MYKVNDVTNWLSQTTDNSKYFVWSPGLWDKESRLYLILTWLKFKGFVSCVYVLEVGGGGRGEGPTVAKLKYIHVDIFLLIENRSQLMRLWYLSYRWSVKAHPSLLAHMKYSSRWRGRAKIRHLAPLDGCACTFEEWIYGGWKVP